MPIELCRCVNADAIQCLASRHQVAKSLSGIMGGCNCRCHQDENGTQIPFYDWQKNRERIARPVRPGRKKVQP